MARRTQTLLEVLASLLLLATLVGVLFLGCRAAEPRLGTQDAAGIVRAHLVSPTESGPPADVFEARCRCSDYVTERTCQPSEAGDQYLVRSSRCGGRPLVRPDLRSALAVEVTEVSTEGWGVAIHYTSRFPDLPENLRPCVEEARMLWLRADGSAWRVIDGSDRRVRLARR